MDLEFRVKNIQPKNDLAHKFTSLHYNSYIQRIYAFVNILDSGSKVIYGTEGIIDTGATISIFPGEILALLDDKFPTQTHTMWGIVNKKECQIIVDLAEISIQLIDFNGVKSHTVNILADFPRNTKVPSLLGMKSFLENYSFNYNITTSKFILSS